MNSRPSWIDLPFGDYSQILGYKNTQIDQLNRLVCAYHDLDKLDQDSLPIRVERLEDIIEFLQNWLEYNTTKADKLKHLGILKDIAEGKRDYLLELVKISLLDNGVLDYINNYHCLKQDFISEWDIIYLNPRRLYSIKKKAYWGDFYWVSLDPCHRQLTHYLMIWEELNYPELNSPIHFFLWLEKQYVPNDFPQEKYFDEYALKATKITIQEGHLYISKENELTLANFNQMNKKYLYVIGLDKQLHLVEETHEIFHSSFYSGKPVYSAGKIRVVDGQITAVSFESGHYIPSIKVGYQLFDFLLKKGVIFPKKVAISYFYDRNKYTTMVENHLLNTFDEFQTCLENETHRQVCNKDENYVN